MTERRRSEEALRRSRESFQQLFDRSEAEFSHGICPDCMKKRYGK